MYIQTTLRYSGTHKGRCGFVFCGEVVWRLDVDLVLHSEVLSVYSYITVGMELLLNK